MKKKKNRTESNEMKAFKDEMYKSYLFNMALYGIKPKSQKEFEKVVASIKLPKQKRYERDY